MNKRYIFREETFGGLIIDRNTGLELMINKEAYLILQLTVQHNLTVDEAEAVLAESGAIPDQIKLKKQINALLKDFNTYFKSRNNIQLKQYTGSCHNNIELSPLNSPISVFWEITSSCNLFCKHCYNDSGNKLDGELSADDCIQLLKEMSEIGISKLIIGGGEPLVKKDFVKILQYADRLGFIIVIATNGTLIDSVFCKEIVSIKRLKLYISLHHFVASKQDTFCGVDGTFDKIVNSINLLNEHKINFGIQSMITEDNVRSLNEFSNFIVSTKTKSWHLKTGVNIGREKNNKSCLGDQDVTLLGNEVEQLRSKIGDTTQIHFELPLRSTINQVSQLCEPRNCRLGCGPGVRNCGLLPNGHLVPCSFLRDKQWISNESVKDTSFLQLWQNSAIFKPFRELNSADIQFCNTCSLLYHGCNGGCRARAYNETGSFYNRDPRCRLTIQAC